MTLPPILQRVADLGHEVFTAEPGSHNGNLVLERFPFSADFDCRVHWLELDAAGRWECWVWRASTWPTEDSVIRPLNDLGTPIMEPGQYRALWREGWHGRGRLRRRALCQIGEGGGDLRVRRVRGLGQLAQLEAIEPMTAAWRGINLHDASSRSGMASIGCPTLDGREALDQLLGLYRRGVPRWGEDITCTLVEA